MRGERLGGGERDVVAAHHEHLRVHDAPRRRGDAARQREQRVLGVARRRVRVVLAGGIIVNYRRLQAPRARHQEIARHDVGEALRLAVGFLGFLLEGVRVQSARLPRLAQRL